MITPIPLATWRAAVDRVVGERWELGLALARARTEVRQYETGSVLMCRVNPILVETLRESRAEYEPVILEACAGVGIMADAVAFVEGIPA